MKLQLITKPLICSIQSNVEARPWENEWLIDSLSGGSVVSAWEKLRKRMSFGWIERTNVWDEVKNDLFSFVFVELLPSNLLLSRHWKYSVIFKSICHATDNAPSPLGFSILPIPMNPMTFIDPSYFWGIWFGVEVTPLSVSVSKSNQSTTGTRPIIFCQLAGLLWFRLVF